MAKSFSDLLIKSIEYFALPFQYPGRFFSLLGKILLDRELVHELPRLTPHRKWFRAAGIRTLIDVGGYIGASAYAFRLMLPEAQIYSFEPLEDNYTRLVRTLEPLGRFEAFRTALGERAGTFDFYRSDFTASSSALPMGELHRALYPHTAHNVEVTVPVARLDDYLPQMDLQPPVMLKMDVQGYEENVLRGAKRLLPRVDIVLLEVSFRPLYNGQATFDGLYTLLKKAGLEYAGSMETMLSPQDGSIMQADALFLRASL